MKRQICMFGVLLLLMSVLGGCGNDEKPKFDGLQPIAMDEPQEGTAGGSPEREEVSPSEGMEVYKAILRGEGEFLESATGERMKLEQVGKAIIPDAEVSIDPDSFAVVDLDGDGEPEVILSLIQNGNAAYGSLILRCQEDVVYGYVFSLREFIQVRTDGTFLSSSGAADVGICRAAFDKENVQVDQFTYSESGYDSGNNLTIAYYVDHTAASKEDYDSAYMRWEALPEVQWYQITDGNIDNLSPSMAVKGAASDPDAASVLPGQIAEQSFDLSLDGWGEVTFAAFAPNEAPMKDANGQTGFGDVAFKLLKDGQVVYTFPGYNGENILYSQQFGQVLAVAFRDYDLDGREDILIIIEYAGVQGSDIDVPFREARAYTQEDGETAFIMDNALSEYLYYYTDSMAQIYEGLESYAKNYTVATSKTTWEVERFAREVRQQILSGDYEGLCMNISFPITVDGTVFQDKEAFLEAAFVADPNPAFLEELRQESCVNMFVNYQGIMLGNGILWLGEPVDANGASSQGLKVIGINGITTP